MTDIPRRYKSAYIIFCEEMLPELKYLKGYDKSNKFNKLNKIWSELSQDQIEEYKQEAEADKRRYYQELETFISNKPFLREWVHEITNSHFPENHIPTWIKKDEFYTYQKKELVELILQSLSCKPSSNHIYIEDWMMVFYSGHVDIGASGGMEGKVDDISIEIPPKVIAEVMNYYLDESRSDK